jgi:hypothetical protein
MTSARYSRNEALFGEEGQYRIRNSRVAIVGLGGLGSHIAQQLVYLGVADFLLIDDDIVTDSSLNRLIGTYDSDVPARTRKTESARRLIQLVAPSAQVRLLPVKVESMEVGLALGTVDVVFGCLDRDAPRLKLTELCARIARPYFDLASDTGDYHGPTFGGRVAFSNGAGCLFCMGLLDQEEMARESLSHELRKARDNSYGISVDALDGAGPAVVSVNGAVASLAITEFMLFVTELGTPPSVLNYYGERRMIRRSVDKPVPECPYCTGLWNRGLD